MVISRLGGCMSKKSLTNTEIVAAKIAQRTSIITTTITVLGSLLGILIATIWGPILLQKWTSTPTPISESTIQTRDWYVLFELKFPPDYWSEGLHSYLFNADCPFGINSTGESEPTYSFSVDRAAEIQDSMIFIRRKGLYLTETEGDVFGHSIHPSQETAAIYSPFALSFDDAKRLQDECKVTIEIDNKASLDLSPIKIDKAK